MANDSGTPGAHVQTSQKLSFTRSRSTRRLPRATTATGLEVDAYVTGISPRTLTPHRHGQSTHQPRNAIPHRGVLALIAMLLVLSSRHRFAAAFALLVATGGLSALPLYGYVDVGSLGPLPDKCDPIRPTQKTVGAAAEAIAALGALCRLPLPRA